MIDMIDDTVESRDEFDRVRGAAVACLTCRAALRTTVKSLNSTVTPQYQ